MDDIIHKIINFEKNAQDIVGKAREERRSYEENMLAQIEAYRAEVENDNKAKIDEYISRLKKETGDSVSLIERESGRRANQLSDIAKKQQGMWVEHLFNIIIDGKKQ